MHLLLKKSLNRPLAFLAAVSFMGTFLLATGVAMAADSSCVTCHIDKEMLKKTVTVKKKTKSAMQSGAG